VSNRLDPEEALAGPLYLVAALLVVIPLADFLLSVPPSEFSNVQWRFAAVGLLAGFMLTPVLGLAMALVVAAVLEHYRVQRWLVAVSLLMATVLIALSLGFVLDMLQVRASVPDEGRAAFTNAWTRAILKHALAATAFAYLGLRARRMIPERTRQRTPKTVHVVSK
jgi:hypothetical protein